MDLIIPLGQKNTLVEYMILSGADNRPPMLDKDLYGSWKSQMELYMQNREHGRMILESAENGPLIWPTVEENRVTITKKYAELSASEKIQVDCDMKATNIILQGLPADIYSLVNHHRVAKDLWERVQLLMQGDDPTACLNKAMAFLTVVASSRFPSTNNKLRTSSNLRNQATIQDVLRKTRQVDRQGLLNATTVNVKDIWLAQEAEQILDEEQLAFLVDLGVLDGQVVQTIIPNNVAFQTEDLDTYDSDCDDISNAKAVLMANISNYGSGVIVEVPHSESYLNDMENQSVHVMQNFEQTSTVDFIDNEIHSDSNIILLSEDFGKCFTPQQEMDAELAFWFRISNPTIESNPPPVKVEVPSELPKVSLVNASLKKLKFHLAQFDSVVKKRTTPDARTEGEWGFEHTKAVFNNESIPFLKSLKDIFNVFDRDLLNEIMEVQTIFDQMDAVVQQFLVDKQCLKIAKKELFLENDRLLQQIMSQDVLLTVMNSKYLIGESINMERKQNESCDKCFNLDAEILKSQNAFNDLLKRYSQLKRHCISLESSIQLNQAIFQKDESCDNQNALEILEFFEHNDLKAQLQDKDTTICKLKDIIKSIRGKSKEENFKYDYCEIETKNVELENRMFKLDLEPLTPRSKQAKAKQPLDKELDFACKHAQRIQELLVYVRDTCHNAINLSAKKVVVTPKNKVKKVRFAEPLTSSSNIKQVESLKISASNTPVLSSTGLKCSTSKYGSKPTGNKRNDRISRTTSRNMKNKVEAQPRKVNKKNCVIEPISDVNVKHSLLNANSEPICATCKKSMLDGVHDMITSANVVPPKKTTSHSVETQKLELKVYSRKPKNVKNVGSSKKAKIVESKNANYSEPNHTWGSNATDIPSSSSHVMTVRFGNDHIARIMGYGDYQLGNVTISRVYYLAKDGLARGIPRLKFQKDHLCSACALGKRKKSSHQPKYEDTNQEKLYLLHMDLCGLMRMASINGKSSGPGLHSMTPVTSSSGLVPNSVS
ncbi:hypothetical protein Tco_0614630 [Tanacetum coccineum]